jgi:hypothetical protein
MEVILVEVSQRVLDMVRRDLVENPEVDNATLYEKARRLYPAAMEDVDRRQFNARYPLRVKRFELRREKPAGEAKPRRRARAQRAGDQKAAAGAVPAGAVVQPAAVRAVLLQFAQDLANAESRGDLVRVVAGVDTYVERILGAAPPAT